MENFKDVLRYLRERKDVILGNPSRFRSSYVELKTLLSYDKPFIRKALLRKLELIKIKVEKSEQIRQKTQSERKKRVVSHRPSNRPYVDSFRAPCGSLILNSSRSSFRLVIRGWPLAEEIYHAPSFRPRKCVECMCKDEDSYICCLNVAANNLWNGWIVDKEVFAADSQVSSSKEGR